MSKCFASIIQTGSIGSDLMSCTLDSGLILCVYCVIILAKDEASAVCFLVIYFAEWSFHSKYIRSCWDKSFLERAHQALDSASGPVLCQL